jgi:molybdopterin-containing oxidoreductase family membrane subunit
MAKLLVLVSLVYLYFNINEFLVPGYKLKNFDAVHLQALFNGHYAGLFWGTQILGLILPIIFLFFRYFRKPAPVFIIALFVMAGAWLKRYLIVVPTMEHPFLPVQHLPLEFAVYSPTLIEITITAGTLFLTLLIITVLSKFLPIIPIWEMTHHESGKPAEKGFRNFASFY